MAYFAEVNTNNLVVRVISADQEWIDAGNLGDPSKWLQTSYNTRGGIHILGGTPFRKNYAGIGYSYDPVRDAFIPPKPFASWVLNEETCLWEAPIPEPSDAKSASNPFGKTYDWIEAYKDWREAK